ncbi:tetratricopeptide repeat protein [Ruminiclostridium herbifermentans]|uniref:Tetratricopeptide repeat protein n=1 Tax=Ruminiclostridium herbifermentans TaxID=2488810 RepID=A0A4U7JDJ6_9FIRM|nr:tetratricopeptide repeat protein [Ruminiclostridium herbifermentans]QNU67681.1 tetratricopeptide repeat protein [Ruminiclostridium herbifermentans]
MLKKAIEEKNLIIVAGAGISAAPPSNLPSWWEFNKLIVDEIKSQTIRLLPESDPLVKPIEIGDMLPVECVSDFFVNSIAGESYFPLLTLLNSAQPNFNHRSIVELAKRGIVSSIVTTNFDTLIEKAFRDAVVPLNIIVTEDDYNECMNKTGCKLFKIHGSATNYDTLIDTTSQKLKGLSKSKRIVLKNIVEGKHVLFMGFSGADLSFDLDYIPIEDALSNKSNITWVIRPGSTPHRNVLKLKEKYGDNIQFLQTELTDLFKQLHIESDEFQAVNNNIKEHDASKIIASSISSLMNSTHITENGCVALCIGLLNRIGLRENARKLGSMYEATLKRKGVNPIDLPSYSTIAICALENGDLKTAQENFNNALGCLQFMEVLHKSGEISVSPAASKELLSNSATIWNNIGIYYMAKNELEQAQRAFCKAKEHAQKAIKISTLVTVYFNLARINYKQSDDADNFINELGQAEVLAKQEGCAEILFDIVCEQCKVLLSLGEYYVVQQKLNEIALLEHVIVNTSKRIVKELINVELLVRRGNNADALDCAKKVADQYLKKENDMQAKAFKTNMVKLLIHYEKAHAFLSQLVKEIKEEDISLPKDIKYPLIFGDTIDTWRKNIIWLEYTGSYSEIPRYFSVGSRKYLAQNEPRRLKDLSECFLDSCERAKDSLYMPEALYNLGCAELMLGNIEVAFGLFEQVTQLKEKASDIYRGWANIEIANILLKQGNQPSAADYYQKGKELLKMSGNVEQLIYAVVAHCNELVKNNNHKQAIEYAYDLLTCFENSLYIEHSENIHKMIERWKNCDEEATIDEESPQAIATKALSAYSNGDRESGYTGINTALERYKEAEDYAGVGRCYNNLGSFCLQDKKFDDAIEYFNKSLDIKIELKDNDGAVAQMASIAHAYFQNGDYENALLKVKQAEAFIESNGYSNNIIGVYFAAGLAYIKINKLADALIYMRLTKQRIEFEKGSLEKDSFERYPSLKEIKQMNDEILKSLELHFAEKSKEPELTEFLRNIKECNRLSQRGEFEKCHGLLDNLLKQKSLNRLELGQIEGTRANAYMNNNDFTKAIEHYKKAIELFDGFEYYKITAIHHLTVALANDGREDESIALSKETLKKENILPENRLFLLQGLANRLINKNPSDEKSFEEIKMLLDECIEITESALEENGIVHVTLMNLYINYNNKELAKKHYIIAKEKFVKTNSRYLDLLTNNKELLDYLDLP